MNHRNLVSAAVAAIFVSAVAFPALAQAADATKTTTHSVHRERGADGAVDATRTGPKGGVTTVDRSKGADGLTDKTVTGPKGGVKTVDRTKNADGTIDKVVTTTRP